MKNHADEITQRFVNEFAADCPDSFKELVSTEITNQENHVVETALSRFRTNSRIFRPSWSLFARVTFVFIAVASASWLLIPNDKVISILRIKNKGSIMSMIPKTPPTITQDPATNLLLHGDQSASDEISRWRALWMSEPDNPVYFSRYANTHLSEKRLLHPDVIEEAQRIDPDNGYWLLVAACVDAEKSLEKTKALQTDSNRSKSSWHAKDEDEVLRRIALLREVTAKPHLRSHQLEYLQTSISKMPVVEGYLGRIHSIAWLASQADAATMQLAQLPKLLEAGMRIAIERNDRELASKIIRDWHHLSRELAHDSFSLIQCLVTQLLVSQPTEFFFETAEKLDLKSEAELIQPILDAVKKVEAFRNRKKDLDNANQTDHDLFEHKGSILSSLTLANPHATLMKPIAPVNSADLRPGRRMEFAFTERIGIPAVAMITCFCFIMIGVNWLLACQTRRAFARRALLLLPTWKLVSIPIIAGAGPLLVYILVTRFTPLGWHEWSLSHGKNVIIIQGFILMSTIVMLPTLLAGIAVEKHTKIFGWCWPGGLTSRYIAILMILAALPASGLILLRDEDSFSSLFTAIVWLFLAALACVASAMIWSAWRQRKEPQRRNPRRLAGGLLAAYARLLTLILLPAWFWLTHIEEKFWAQRDTLMHINLESPAVSSYESKIQILMREQIIETMGPVWPE